MSEPGSAFGAELDRTGTADLSVLVLGRPDPDAPGSLLGRARLAAAVHPDRTESVMKARRDVAELMFIRLNRAGFVVTWAGLPWAGASPLRVEDRVWLNLAAQDAATAEMLADRLSSDDRDQLRAAWDVVASMPGLGYSGVPAIRGRLGIAVAMAFLIAVVVIGALPSS